MVFDQGGNVEKGLKEGFGKKSDRPNKKKSKPYLRKRSDEAGGKKRTQRPMGRKGTESSASQKDRQGLPGRGGRRGKNAMRRRALCKKGGRREEVYFLIAPAKEMQGKKT